MLTPDLAIIMEAMRGSATTELAATGLALRARDTPTCWVLPLEQRDAPAAYPQVAPPAADASGNAQQAPQPAAAAADAAAGNAATSGAAQPAAASGAAAQPGQEPATAPQQQDQQQDQRPQQRDGATAAPPAEQKAAAASVGGAAGEARAAHPAEEHDDMFQLDEVRSQVAPFGISYSNRHDKLRCLQEHSHHLRHPLRGTSVNPWRLASSDGI